MRMLAVGFLAFAGFLPAMATSLRRAAIGAGAVAAVVAVACLGLWWRLSSGPIQLDVVTPWLASAIEENFGNGHRVEVGGTQIERTENGGTAVRIRDIVVRDADGTVVASAPKAEVRVSGLSLLRGHMRAESLNLVGAEMAVRIEQDGGVTIFAGADKHPIATAAVPATAAAALLRSAREKQDAAVQGRSSTGSQATLPPGHLPTCVRLPPHRARELSPRCCPGSMASAKAGLDGHDLRELGLKNGNLTVDDARTGKRWTFRDISMSVDAGARRRRRSQHRLVQSRAAMGADGADHADPPTVIARFNWRRAAFRRASSCWPRGSTTEICAVDLPLSASVHGEIGPDGVPQNLPQAASLPRPVRSATPTTTTSRIPIDHAEFKFNWDAENRVLSMPFQILSGGNRITLLGQIEAPQEAGGTWLFKIGGGGTIVLNSRRRNGRAPDPQPHRRQRPLRCGQAALRRRRGRCRQYGRRHRHVRQP